MRSETQISFLNECNVNLLVLILKEEEDKEILLALPMIKKKKKKEKQITEMYFCREKLLL